MTKRLIKVILIVFLLVQPIIESTTAQQTSSELNLVNLIVEGNETRIISDTRLTLEGIIEVKENATLRLENVRVRFIESELDHSFNIKDNASLTIADSDIKQIINVNQHARLNASNSKLIESFYCTIHGYNHTTGGVIGNDCSEIILDNCRLGYLWLHNESIATVKNSYIYYSFPEDAYLSVKDSTIQTHRENLDNVDIDIVIPDFTKYSGGLDTLLPASNSIFDNVSLVDGLWLQSYNSSIKIHDSQLYYIGAVTDSHIQLTNVTLNTVSNYMRENEFALVVNDCDITQILSYFSNATIVIDNSRINRVSLTSYKQDLNITNSVINELDMDDVWFKPFKAYIMDSSIGFFRPGLGNEEPNEYYLHNVTLLDGLCFNVGGYTPTGGVDLHGELRFGAGFSINVTRVNGYAIINRFYPVFVNSTIGSIANVSLVASNGNRTLWIGETSLNGVAEVPVRFVKIFYLVRPYNASGPSVIQANNMTDVVTLSWSVDDNEGSIALDLLSDTPIVVEVPDESGYGNLFVLALVAIIVVAVIFYNKR